MVPKVSISSVVMPFLDGLGSIELVGVRECEEPEDEEPEPERRLRERKKERPFDLGHPDDGAAAPFVDGDLGVGRVGGRQMGMDAGEAGSEPDASLLVVFVREAGVVEPDSDGLAESLLRFEDEPKLLRLEISWEDASTA
jgi:hypothetical protein